MVRPAEVLQELGGCNQLAAGSCVLPGQGGWCVDLHSQQHMKGIIESDDLIWLHKDRGSVLWPQSEPWQPSPELSTPT